MPKQAFWLGHLGVDNLGVVRSISRLLDHGFGLTPLPLVKDGNIVSLLHHMIQARGPDTVRITEVEGQTTDEETQWDQARVEDQFGGDEADAAAGLGAEAPV